MQRIAIGQEKKKLASLIHWYHDFEAADFEMF